MSTHSKGLRNERKCQLELERLGWRTEKKNWSKFGGKDFWGVFDILAIKDGAVLAIQVKTNRSNKSDVRVKFNKIKEHIPASWTIQLWVWKDRKGWDVHDLKN